MTTTIYGNTHLTFSPLVLCDSLLSLAQHAADAGLRATANRLLALANSVLDERPVPRTHTRGHRLARSGQITMATSTEPDDAVSIQGQFNRFDFPPESRAHVRKSASDGRLIDGPCCETGVPSKPCQSRVVASKELRHPPASTAWQCIT